MKKQYILIISIIVLVIIGCVFFFKSKQDNNFNPQIQNIEEATIDSLSIGNWVSVAAEKDNGSYVALLIMACNDKNSCQSDRPSQNNNQQPLTGESPAGNNKTGVNMENKTMLSGTIIEVNAENIVLNLDTAETATVLITDSTKIIKR